MHRPSRSHPPERALVALADRELPWRERAGLAHHLLGCPRCRQRLAGIQEQRAEIRRALHSLDLEPGTEGAWQRFAVLAALRPARRSSGVRRLATAAALVVAVGGALWPSRPAAPTHEFLRALEALPSRADLQDAPPARAAREDAAFIRQLLALAASGEARVVRDVCCNDHDGEGPADDGLFAAAVPREGLSLHVMYDDADRTQTLSPGDLVRSVAKSTLVSQSRRRDPERVSLALRSER
ncbi:MAG: zf-HC2 domain-containing protein [Gemmatimonadales bacterium]|nr:zf-HC2 domain-containing protein [Gemmatimonadales bacterium]